MHRLVICATAVLLLAGCGGGGSSGDGAAGSGTTRSKADTVTLTDKDSGFSIQAPRGFKLDVNDGVYVLRKGETSMSFSRSVTNVGADQYGAALLEQIGGDVISQGGDAGEFTAEIDRVETRDTFVVARDDEGVAVTTARAPAGKPLSIATVRRVGASARGGYELKAPKTAATSMKLEPYQAPDGGATAQIPAGGDWNVSSTGGNLEGSNDKGAFLLGFTIQPFLPESVPQGIDPGGSLVVPYSDAATALGTVLPKLNPRMSDVQIRSTVKDAVLPSFTSSAMYEYDFKIDGKPWVGVATVASDSPEKYSNFVWGFYYSGISVPAGSDPSVGAGLLKVWNSWNPSGAIAQRSQASKELLDATNEVWQETSEFRAETADRQSRDVGCLLQGYYAIEDNSREYDLPPLPCGQAYGPGADE